MALRDAKRAELRERRKLDVPLNPTKAALGSFAGQIAGKLCITYGIHEGDDVLILNYTHGANRGVKLAIEALAHIGIEVDPDAFAEGLHEAYLSEEDSRDTMQELNPGLPRGWIGFGDA